MPAVPETTCVMVSFPSSGFLAALRVNGTCGAIDRFELGGSARFAPRGIQQNRPLMRERR